jgi:hypothetical protein
MTENQRPEGELFARLYLERGAPAQDSQFFRNRLEAFLLKNHHKDYAEIAGYLKEEAGLIVEVTWQEKFGVFYNFAKFVTETRIEHLLSAITLIWRFLYGKHAFWRNKEAGIDLAKEGYYDRPQAAAWLKFVERALREENMAYTVDAKCGLHYYVDEEFERNRHSALKALESPRYAGARAAFEDAYKHFDGQPADTKAAVRSAFEAVEVLARLIVPESKNLNRWLVENKLKPLAVRAAKDAPEADAITKIFDGIAQCVDGLHYYRHGQGVERAVAPTLTLTVYAISSAAATLRWLAEIDSQNRTAA